MSVESMNKKIAANKTNKHNTCGKTEEQMKKTGVVTKNNKHDECGKVGKQMKKKTTEQAGNVGRVDSLSKIMANMYKHGVSIVKRNGECIVVEKKTAEQITRFLETCWDNDCIGLLAGANGDSYQISAYYCCDHEDELDQNEMAGNPWLMGMDWHLGDYCNMVSLFRADENLECIAEQISRTPMEICCKLTETGLVNDEEAQYLKSLVTFSAPASLSVLNREPVAA